jgi:hypothetical protein
MGQLTPVEREVLIAVVDTAVPALAVESDPTGFWGRCGSDVGAEVVVRRFVEGLPDQRFDAVRQLLATLDRLGIRHRDRTGQEVILHRAPAAGRSRERWRCRAGVWWPWRPAGAPPPHPDDVDAVRGAHHDR